MLSPTSLAADPRMVDRTADRAADRPGDRRGGHPGGYPHLAVLVGAHGDGFMVVAMALLLAAVAPIGLASGEAADLAASAFGVRRPLIEARPLTDLLARLAALVPFGEIGARPHALAALAGLGGLALLLARLRLTARSGVAMVVAAGAIVVAVSPPFLEVATLRADLALDFTLLAGIAFLLESLRRDPARQTLGLGLAFVSGLAAGGGWPVRAAAWPLGTVLTIWALRRGHRWPLMAPLAFVAGTGVAFAAVVAAASIPAPTAGALFRQIILPSSTSQATAWPVLASTADDVGVLAVLVAVIGCVVLLVRGRADAVAWILLWAGAAFASLVVADVAFARLVLVTGLAAPIAAATAALARAFGRARAAATIVMTVVVAVTPALGGVASALRRAEQASAGTVTRRLDAVVDRLAVPDVGPTDPEAARWGRYVRAVAGACERQRAKPQ